MKKHLQVPVLVLAIMVFAGVLAAETTSAARYDTEIQPKVSQTLAARKQFEDVKATVDDGIVTLSGTVSLYQQKLDAEKRVRKLANVHGVRNLIEVAGNDVSDLQLAARLDRKLYFDREGYDIAFNYITASVSNGVVTLNGEARLGVTRDSAFAIASDMPGVKDVVNNVRILPTSIFDDQIRVRTLRAIYRDPVLSRYAIDPAKPIRIVVDNGHVALYGTVSTQMDKTVAGLRANQVFGAFSVKNNLEVEKKS